jgi:hypothetical protein
MTIVTRACRSVWAIPAGCCSFVIRVATNRAIIDALGGHPWPRALGLPTAALLDDDKRSEIARRIWRESSPA